MHLNGIELQRISLGALVIALGMLVDNAIVVADGMLVRMQSGMKAVDAARETVGKYNLGPAGRNYYRHTGFFCNRPVAGQYR